MTDNVLNYSIVDLRHDLSFHFVLFFFLFGNTLFTALKNITVQCTRYSAIGSLIIIRRETDVDCMPRKFYFQHILHY